MQSGAGLQHYAARLQNYFPDGGPEKTATRCDHVLRDEPLLLERAQKADSAAVGCAIPVDKKTYGYISEHHAFGFTEKKTGDYAEDLAAAMLASTLGIDFDVDESWDEKKELFRISGKIVGTRNTTQSAVLKTADYTTVLAAAVFVL